MFHHFKIKPAHINGMIRNQSLMIKATKKKKVVVLGTGWGSYSVLKNINKKLYDVISVSPRNHFLFTPLLCSTTVGTLEFRSIIEPIRNDSLKDISFHLSSAVALDTSKQTLTCNSSASSELKSNFMLDYDILIIGVGAECNTFNIKGVKEYAYFLKEITDARKIRTKLITNFELASLPTATEEDQNTLLHIVIVGGGPTGVEFGAEVYDFLKEDVSHFYPDLVKKVKVTLIEASHILSSFDQKLRKYAEKKISTRSQFSLKQASVAEVKSNSVVLNTGEILDCGLVVWSTGVSPRKFINNVELTKNNIGQLLTDKNLKVLDTENVYALGDCADIKEVPLPCTAQVAERQGRWLAKHLNGKTRNSFQFQNLGMLAYIGGYKALSDLKPAHLKLIGFSSWLVWRSAYLTRLGSWKLRMQVPIDWTKTFIFGRDTSKF